MIVDILALLLGVIYTLRKLDVKRREPSEFPHVDPVEFASWKEQELRAYNLASWACFLKIGIDYGFQFIAKNQGWDWGIVRIVGLSLFVLWLITLVVAAIKGSQGRQRRQELGIVFRPHLKLTRQKESTSSQETQSK